MLYLCIQQQIIVQHMKKILFITDTYYPDNCPTTNTVKNTAEALVKHGYEVEVYPAEIKGTHFDYPSILNGVRIKIPVIGSQATYDYVISMATAFEVNILAKQIAKDLNCMWFPISFNHYAYEPDIEIYEKRVRIQHEIFVLKDATRIFFFEDFRDYYNGSPLEKKIDYFTIESLIGKILLLL